MSYTLQPQYNLKKSIKTYFNDPLLSEVTSSYKHELSNENDLYFWFGINEPILINLMDIKKLWDIKDEFIRRINSDSDNLNQFQEKFRDYHTQAGKKTMNDAALEKDIKGNKDYSLLLFHSEFLFKKYVTYLGIFSLSNNKSTIRSEDLFIAIPSTKSVLNYWKIESDTECLGLMLYISKKMPTIEFLVNSTKSSMCVAYSLHNNYTQKRLGDLEDFNFKKSKMGEKYSTIMTLSNEIKFPNRTINIY